MHDSRHTKMLMLLCIAFSVIHTHTCTVSQKKSHLYNLL